VSGVLRIRRSGLASAREDDLGIPPSTFPMAMGWQSHRFDRHT
jgi:hypothetical protein